MLNFDTGTVYTKEGPSKMVFGHLDKVCRITVAETITLSPNMVANIPCQVRETVSLNELEGVLEPSEKFTERYAAGAFRTAVTIKDGRVFNPLNKPLKIYRSSRGAIPITWWRGAVRGGQCGYQLQNCVSWRPRE